MVFSLALRNVLRNKRRTLLTMAGIVAGTVSILLLGGYYEYNYWGLRESFIRSQYAHVQITKKGYWAKQEQDPFAFMIPRSPDLVALLESQGEVETVSAHLNYFGILDTASGDSELVMVRGVDPERENGINTFFTRKSGRDLVAGDLGFAELGLALARKANLDVGSDFSLSTVSSDGAQNALPLKVKGMIGSYSADFDSKILRIPLETAQILAGADGVQEIVVLLKDTDKTASFRNRILPLLREKGWDLEVTTWDQHAGYYAQVVQFYGGYFRLILMIVIVVVFFSTLNTMIMSIFERIAEVGTLRSFGTGRLLILAQFLCEGGVLGLAGTAAGVILAFVGALVIRLAGGIPMPPPPGLTTSVAVQIMITPHNVAVACLIGVGVPLIASLLPSVHMVRTQIIDQIRHGS
ncbi:MAG: ABC transporter permease [Treponema sp.]|nr:MAG: ABC transporter permease [Treponema sp.]